MVSFSVATMLVALVTIVAVGIVCSETEINYKTDTVNNVDHHKVVLKPPSNISTFLVGSTKIYLVWEPPSVYTIHDVNITDTTWSDDNTTVNTTSTEAPETTSTLNNDSLATGTIVSDSSINRTENNTVSPLSSTSTVPSTSNSQGTTVSVAHKGNNSGTGMLVKQKSNCKSYEYLKKRTFNGDYIDFAASSKTPEYVHNAVVKDTEINITIGVNEAMVSFDEGCVEEYTVYIYHNGTGELVQRKTLQGDRSTEMSITDLKASTTYKIIVGALFTSTHKLNSTNFYVTTKADPDDRACECYAGGTIGGRRLCDTSSGLRGTWCPCKTSYSGLFCEICQPGYYKTAMFFPCHACPCSHHSSELSSCHFMEGFLVCDKCRTGYTGNLCHQCTNGYYRFKNKYCVQCRCYGNTDPKAPMICDPYSGACASCVGNTTGFNCERCRKGYVGDAILYKNCTHHSEAVKEPLLPIPANYIAGICVGTILLLCFIVGSLVYKRYKMYPTMKPFWTVELKEDHEGVNFSAVEDQEFLKNRQTNEEGAFYEKRGGKGMKYAQLKEDV